MPVLKELLLLFGEGAAPESFQPLIRTAIAVPRAIAQASVSVLQRACLMASLLPAHTLGDLTVAAGIAHGAIEGVCQICLTNLPLLTAPVEQSELLTELRALIGEADACRVRLAQWTEKQEPYSLLLKSRIMAARLRLRLRQALLLLRHEGVSAAMAKKKKLESNEDAGSDFCPTVWSSNLLGGIIMEVFVARQPIFDIQQKVFAYELLFRVGKETAFNGLDGDEATSEVICRSFFCNRHGYDDRRQAGLHQFYRQPADQ